MLSAATNGRQALSSRLRPGAAAASHMTMRNRFRTPYLSFFFFCLTALASVVAGQGLRPPAVPLVSCDPYFSIWSRAVELSAADTVHWTGRPHRLTALARIDGRTFRLMGKDPAEAAPLRQTALEVTPTCTTYHFEGEGLELALSFLTPAVPYDLGLYSSPVTYVTCGMKAHDGHQHEVSIYLDAAAELTVNQVTQEVVWSRELVRDVRSAHATPQAPFRFDPRQKLRLRRELEPSAEQLTVLKVGSREQPTLQKKGDDLRIDWGYLYVAAAANSRTRQTVGPAKACWNSFIQTGSVPDGLDPRQPRAANDERPVAATVFAFGKVGSSGVRPRMLMLAYDDLFSIQYFKKDLRPYWRRNGAEAADLLRAAAFYYPQVVDLCESFDRELMADLAKAGGEKYARICALVYRQCVAGNKLAADAKGKPLLFPKENTSNGCIGTVDVIYPMAPQFLLFGPSLTKAMLVPNLDYASSPRWKWPFAPHDLGTYPLANGQVYGGGERTEENQMPVEETGNMLILLAALAHMEGNADFDGKYWPVLTKWAEYLKEKGFDPENQLCTDDFMGHLAHNVNLSVKATLGIASFAYLCELRGRTADAAAYRQLARDFAARWVKEADDGDHFRLAFDKPGTWSQKYNLVWDKILGFDLYPDSARRKEMEYYLKVKKPFGVPLDNRGDGAKLDWSLWTATLTQDRSDFEAVMEPVYRFLNETPDRVGAGDFYNSANGRHIGMHSRPVVGGVFLQMLYDKGLWKKWSGRDRTRAGGWAALPEPPKVTIILPAADEAPANWRYTVQPPAAGWMNRDFDDSSWLQGRSGFGTAGTPGAIVGTTWNTADIWLRREIALPAGTLRHPELWLHHDEDAEVYINGILASRTTGWTTSYDLVPILPPAKATLKAGKNLLAIHCHQTSGGQYIDVGLADVE